MSDCGCAFTETVTSLCPEHWAKFKAWLDKPAEPSPGLTKLFRANRLARGEDA